MATLRMKTGSHHSGFTLIELLVAITIGSILLALAVPSFTTVVQNNRRAAYVNEFVGALIFARSEAVTLRRPVVICRSRNPNDAAPTCDSGSDGRGWHDGWVIFSEPPPPAANGVFDPATDTVLAVHEALAADQTSLCGNNPVRNRVTFTKTGFSNNAGSVIYCDSRGNGSGRDVAISPVGRVVSTESPAECRRATASPPVCS